MNELEKKPLIRLQDILFILLSCSIYSMGVALVLSPNGIAPGGVYGIAIIINNITAPLQTTSLTRFLLGVGTLTVVLNIPILIVGVCKLKLRFLISTICAIILQNSLVAFWEFAKIKPLTDDLMLAAVCGGAMVGLCVGVLFRAGATCGGSDVIVRLLRLRWRYMKTGAVFLIIDGTIVALSAFAPQIGIEKAMYAAVALFVQSMVLNFVLYGSDTARLVYIISDKAQAVAEPIMALIIGITYLSGEGGYNKQSKKVIMCVVRKRQLPNIRAIVKEVDPDAFMIVTSANQVLGHRFKDIKEDDL